MCSFEFLRSHRYLSERFGIDLDMALKDNSKIQVSSLAQLEALIPFSIAMSQHTR